MKILVVAPYVPYEGIPHAGGSYLLHHLSQLTRLGSCVTLIVPGTPEQLVNARLAPDWLNLVSGPPVLEGRGWMRRMQDAAYRRAMNPPAPSAETLRSVVRAGLVERAREADIVELHWAEYARFASVLRRADVNTPICIVEHDVDLQAAVERVKNNTRGYRRLLGLLTTPLARRQEHRGLVDADVVCVFTQADEQTLRRAGIHTAVQLIDPWLDEPRGPGPTRRARSVLFAGALWRRENEDGLVWFLERVWPQVRAAVPEATLLIVGASPGDRLKAAAARTQAVDVIEDVPDLLPYYRSASLFVAPLFVKGGLKFKVPQAMLCGLPVIATTVAAEGVAELAPADAFWRVTNDPAEMTISLIGALTNEAAASRVGEIAAQWCRENYSFPRSIASLQQAYFNMSQKQKRPEYDPRDKSDRRRYIPN
jgi:glycosyltransferase involved in cell wall biosynthesis